MNKVSFREVELVEFSNNPDHFFTGEIGWKISFLGFERFVLITETQFAYIKYQKRYEHVKAFRKVVDRMARLSCRSVEDVLWEFASNNPKSVKPNIRDVKKGQNPDYMDLSYENFKEHFNEAIFIMHQVGKVIVTDPLFDCEFYLLSDQEYAFQLFCLETEYDKAFKARLKRSVQQGRRDFAKGRSMPMDEMFARIEGSRGLKAKEPE